MARKHFNNYKDFACEINDVYASSNIDGSEIVIIAKYIEAREVIKELLCLGYTLHSITLLEDPCLDGYYDEYIISVTNIDEHKEIWCEPMKRDNGYIDNDCSVITYILDNCSSEVVSHCFSENIQNVSVGDKKPKNKCDCSHDLNETLECEYEGLDVIKDVHGFSASKSDDNSYRAFSYYSTEELSTEDIQTLIRELGFK